MKKTILYSSAVIILLFTLMSFSASNSDAIASGFTPFKVGQTYKVSIVGGFGGATEVTILEAQKGFWVKVNIKNMGMRYLNINNISLVKPL